jgi:hypothetical protein
MALDEIEVEPRIMKMLKASESASLQAAKLG